MKVLVVTNMYPNPEQPAGGIFVQEQVRSLRETGIEVDVLFVNGRKSRWNYLWGFFRLWARLLSRRYQLIHAHYVYSGIIARAQFFYPVIVTYHGVEVFLNRFKNQGRLCRWLAPLVDRVIVVSPEMKTHLRRGRVIVIPCGIDLERVRPIPRNEARQRLGLSPDRKLVMSVGSYAQGCKRPDLAGAAAQEAKDKDPAVELMYVFGRPYQEMPLFFNAADVLVLVSDGEGSPMVVKEAMACNLPVVATPVGDIPELIGGTDGCFLCGWEPGEIADKLRLAIGSGRTKGRERMGEMGLEKIASRLVSLYQQVLQEMER
ncbi:MAG: glycosyltransferase [Chloroflexi bacterium]|nr:glycosyltransferase [Chloroflexota bacterium]